VEHRIRHELRDHDPESVAEPFRECQGGDDTPCLAGGAQPGVHHLGDVVRHHWETRAATANGAAHDAHLPIVNEPTLWAVSPHAGQR
jgi:hypothetical protein